MRFPALIVILGVAPAFAEVPRTPTLTRYSSLWTNSPFTSEPPPPQGAAAQNPLDDYSLGGISKLNDGYYAILINRKNPAEPKKIIRPGTKSDFEVVEVNWSDTNWKDTVAVIRHQGKQGSVTFDNKLLTVNSSAPTLVPPPQENPGLPPGLIQPTPAPPPVVPAAGEESNKPPMRAPRPRVVVPPKQ